MSKFSKVSLFSGLNNLDDITLDPSHSSICGFTEEDLGTVFPPELEGALASEKLLGTFDVGRIAKEALLFQTGYLTVTGVETEAGREFYRLGYPNREVRESLNESLLDYLTGKRGGRRSIWARCEGFRGRETSRGWRSASGRCSQRPRSTGTGAAGSTASRGTTRA